jgi:hypothetical protein
MRGAQPAAGPLARVLQRADVAAGHRLEPWLGGGVIVVAFGFWVEAKTFGPRRDEGDPE